MSINQRRHNRLAVDLPVFRFTPEGERLETLIYQISVGGCLIEWDDAVSHGETFRMEIQLPNQNWLPLQCKAVYCFTDDAIGVQFEDISQFEQDLLVEVMSNKLTREGIPFNFDPYSSPSTYEDDEGIANSDSEGRGKQMPVPS
ncbi:MAG: PilZ domain-containing protein [Acidobacteria bacterium]|nr:MAG: PilZ domain-containing protein [Acidobacteriota bacterium]REK02243.1 MAG: PilZ domain-containing protein [Acidobacteriota bacterium]REK13954.1 MAG: PilZ domain-containing protein [Acidobacteriota bacterium]REK41948.1 MAG: PilZ domain-containing protein [Acidobacteriota bacterium]